jgi:sugar phosphate isomerase/epimerase
MIRYPFPVGTTSFVYHADILTNVQNLASLVDDIELVLFVVEKEDNLPSPGLLDQITGIAGPAGMGFTVHLPLHLALGGPRENDRLSSVCLAADIINLTECIRPRGYIIHLNRDTPGAETTDESWTTWTEFCCTSLADIINRTGAASCLCIENLESYEISRLEPVLSQLPVSLCLDIGHLWVQGINPVPVIEHYAENIRIIHLHGIDKRDHSSLEHMEFREVKNVMDALLGCGFTGVVTLEVFGYDDLLTSLTVLKRWAGERNI